MATRPLKFQAHGLWRHVTSEMERVNLNKGI